MSRVRPLDPPRLTGPTTWVERFRAALALLCGGTPPSAVLVEGWFGGDDERLQHWASEHGALGWHQGIALIDAAALIADQPEEGAAHAPSPWAGARA